ncbi:hypothetical protein FRC02_007487 [Tulasnella sp. 418]|nr:hypothetical protein FRC02_007487 [Tulasnella sp. 418]
MATSTPSQSQAIEVPFSGVLNSAWTKRANILDPQVDIAASHNSTNFDYKLPVEVWSNVIQFSILFALMNLLSRPHLVELRLSHMENSFSKMNSVNASAD